MPHPDPLDEAELLARISGLDKRQRSITGLSAPTQEQMLLMISECLLLQTLATVRATKASTSPTPPGQTLTVHVAGETLPVLVLPEESLSQVMRRALEAAGFATLTRERWELRNVTGQQFSLDCQVKDLCGLTEIFLTPVVGHGG